MSETPSIQFGTDGWRGIIAADFTFANVCRVTRAIAHYLSATYPLDQPVLVAYDTRFLADQFAQTAAQVLAEAGWHVKMADRDCPTPAIAYHAKHLTSAGALMFTASHNPASYCGIKYIPDYAGPATTDITDAIALAIPHMSAIAPTNPNPHHITSFDPKPDYLQSIYQFLDLERIRRAQLSVKYDALYSTSRGYLDTALKHCECTVEVLHAHRDVLFGGSMPDPKGDRLSQLIAAVRRDGAAVGLATDGDSDRYGIVDEQGNVLPPNAVMLLLARHLIKHKGKTGAIVRTVATTRLLDTFAQQHGLELYETPVGFKYIGQKMREIPVLIGGEESGGLSVLGHIPEKDGILANLLVLEAIAYENKPLSQLVNDVIAEVGGPLLNHRIDLQLNPIQRSTILQSFVQSPPTQIAGISVKAVGYKDGIKLYLDNGDWILLRLSGTEPLLRVYMETATLDQQKRITKAMQELIQAIE
ncbi:MAG: phosphoglucomutase/phosphomannomutase family protein [Oculatellaceae cyanobacterium bins.114]|nr:phosphoglucomutase/phosphomannomutase family protein [Oculatellaceae cyanobacterium bins.114]